MITIKEIIVVEGRDDSAAIKRSVNAETIETHGFGIRKEILTQIEKAYLEKGIIIFTDPDFSGEQIRKRLEAYFPKAKHAYLMLSDAEKNGDIGVENAHPDIVIEALKKAKASSEEASETFSYEDIQRLGLVGDENATQKRAEIGKALGIGYGNAKAFLNKLNKYGITMEELNEIILANSHNGT